MLLVPLAALLPLASVGCGPPAGGLRLLEAPREVALNEVVELRFDRELDPLSVTARSLSARADGRPAPVALRVEGRRIEIRFDVDAALLAAPPAVLELDLTGRPSLHALRAQGGAPLEAPRRLRVALRGELVADDERARLVSVGSGPVPDGGVWTHDGRLRLRFDGVLDPQTLRPEALPLVPRRQGLDLAPLHPALRWTVRGAATELEVEVPDADGPLELRWDRVGLRDLGGELPEAPLVISLSRT